MRSLHLGLVVAALALVSCTDRALDPDTSFVFGPDADLAGLDLFGVDLAHLQSGVDLGAPVDLAAALGVSCGGAQCQPDQICCGLSGQMTSKCFPASGMMGGCPFGQGGFRCDGPEDCAMGRRCIAMGAFGHVESTRCRMDTGL